MAITVDPTGKELAALKKAVSWRGKRVLEIGCGDGRLTLRLASLGAKRIEAIDPNAGLIQTARHELPARYRERISYHVGHAERLRFPDGAFDIVVFSWAL